jgi:hypothetical protein
VLIPHHQNAGQNHNMKVANKTLKDAAKFIYLGFTVINQNCICKEIRNILNLKNACHLSFQNILSFCLLSENVKIKIYKTIILCVVLY